MGTAGAGAGQCARERVPAAVRELGHRPNSGARAHITLRPHTLGVVSFETTPYGSASMLYGVEQAVRSAGHFAGGTSLRPLDGRSVRGSSLTGCATRVWKALP
ncbi:hypothetical protein ABZY57_29010 [Streptomyces sp. NPDC006450]|uniref:hypothetical protein n=1 Tax=Streptomyces sp. NPDC006450 TaxID=3155458 RepID=UPI0033B72DA6